MTKMKNNIWKLFEKTGNINLYNIYKEQERKDERGI